jgi:phage tail sheath protein FI
MPEYLAPGVFVEEVSYRSKSIEGVSTTTTGFIGPTRYGPLDQELEVITSLVEFERTYGDGQRLVYGDVVMDNFMWHATRAFFEQGGKRLYVRRVYHAGSDPDGGHATGWLPASAGNAATRPPGSVRLRARFPGAAGDRRVRITLSLGPNILGGAANDPRVAGLREHDVVWISDQPSPPAVSPPPAPADTGSFYLASTKQSASGPQFEFKPLSGGSNLQLSTLTPNIDPGWSDKVRVVTATITAYPNDPTGQTHVWGGLPLDYRHEVGGARDSLLDVFAEEPASRALARTVPITIDDAGGELTGLQILQLLLNEKSSLAAALADPEASESQRSVDILLTGGDDGVRPLASDYSGQGVGMSEKAGLKAFEDIDDISIVAAPGSTFDFGGHYGDQAATIIQSLIGHAELMRYRIAVLDAGNGQSISEVQDMRGALDSKHAAFYYPWVRILDPITQRELDLPPSGYVCGIYARNDINRAVYKAPANEVVTGAIGFERLLNKAQQEVLNPQGVNCFRFFEGRGYRLWGARTISSDPEWKYVNVRRYFAYLEHSIDRGTQWAVFEPNGEALWANVRRTVSDFLFNEFVGGAFVGTTPDTAYFVKCDRSTMTQNDLDNGRLVCLIGVAVVKPAEFVIFRIGQWTGDRKV